MKQRTRELLVCPTCKSDLDLHVRDRHVDEIMSGALRCAPCAREYPIIRGIPRFVANCAYASSFGKQWNWFRDVQLDSRNGTRESAETLWETTGWRAEDYKGRLLLDAGVGAGRFAEVAAGNGAEVVGIDLTDAVDAAYANVGRHERVHIVQADIFAMPVRDGAFDLAYSIGVLHHTPDPQAAFQRVARAVKKSGQLAIYVYSRYGLGVHTSDLLRKVTTRLPVGVMFYLAAAAVPLYVPYRLPVIGKLLQTAIPISLHSSARWRWLDTFDWYTPQYQWKFRYPEVLRWFRTNGFLDVEVFDQPIRMRGVKNSEASI
jgi:SAM-dependent methyltransferase